MTTSHIIMNPQIEVQRLQALAWLESNVDKDKWQLEGKFGTNLVFTDLEDEFKFKLVNSDLSFIRIYTKETK